MCDILKMAYPRAKRSEMCDSGILVTHTWSIFDFVVFKVILGSFGAFVTKLPVSRKGVVVDQNGLKFGTRIY